MSTTLTTDQIVEALASLKAEIGIDSRIRHVETELAGIKATLAAQSKPSQWPVVVSSIAGLVGVLVAFAALLSHPAVGG